jgi:hypothetical protein
MNIFDALLSLVGFVFGLLFLTMMLIPARAVDYVTKGNWREKKIVSFFVFIVTVIAAFSVYMLIAFQVIDALKPHAINQGSAGHLFAGGLVLGFLLRSVLTALNLDAP